MTSRRAAVVGAGVAGLGVAWRLARRGWSVSVYDRGEAGRGTSWAAAGMLAPSAEIGFEELDLYALGRDSLERWPQFAAELEAAAGQSVGLDTSGTLVVADDRDSAAVLRRLYAFQQAHGAPVEWLSADQALEREPMLSPRVPAAIWSPADHQVDNRAVIQALVAACRAAGVEIQEHTEVDAVAPGPSLRLHGGARAEADAVVVAAGAWAAGLDGLAPVPPVRPVKGQALSVRMTDALRVRHTLRGPRAYLVPKPDGRLIVGATSEERGFDTAVTAGGLYRLLDGAVRVLPGIEELDVVETWAGLRPAAQDHAPLLGRSALPGVTLATGLYRHGFLLLPVVAEAIADEVEAAQAGREPAPRLAPFLPSRFSSPT